MQCRRQLDAAFCLELASRRTLTRLVSSAAFSSLQRGLRSDLNEETIRRAAAFVRWSSRRPYPRVFGAASPIERPADGTTRVGQGRGAFRDSRCDA